MTVTYTDKVATSKFGSFLRLLVRWRGSVYKLIWRELLLFIILYCILSFTYRFALNEEGQKIFEQVSLYCDMYSNLIPLAFVLGFYVSVVVGRWWDQFNSIPWPDRMAMFVTATIHGQDDRGRLMRRTVMRYLCLAFVITMSSISPPCKKRFPKWSHMTEAGFMNPNEEKIIDSIQTPHNKYFVPLAWTTALLSRARKEGRIKDDFALQTLLEEVNAFRGKLGMCFRYDWISLPLVYTQTVTLATYSFFVSCLMGRQFTKQTQTIDVYVPFFTILQFIFYMGWLKVAETLVNPFGCDDDDFDINSIIDRNLQVSYLVVDEIHSEHPQLIKDQYWDEVQFDLPYTAATAENKEQFFMGSAMNISISPKDSEFVPLQSVREEDDDRGDQPAIVVTGNAIDIARSPNSKKSDFVRSISQSSGSNRGLKIFGTKRSNSRLSPKTQRQKSVQSSEATTPVDEKMKALLSKDDIFKMSDTEFDATEGQTPTSEYCRRKGSKRVFGVFVDPPISSSVGSNATHTALEEGDDDSMQYSRSASWEIPKRNGSNMELMHGEGSLRSEMSEGVSPSSSPKENSSRV